MAKTPGDPSKDPYNDARLKGTATGTKQQADDGSIWEYYDNGDGTGQWIMDEPAPGFLDRRRGNDGGPRSGPAYAAEVAKNNPPVRSGGVSSAEAQRVADSARKTAADAAAGPYGPNAYAARDRQNSLALGLAGQTANNTQQGALQLQGTQNQAYINALNGLAQQQVAAGQGANAADQTALGTYNSQISPYFTPIKGQSASQYASNPADVAAQRQALQQLQGIASGSLDYQSQGAQAFADPRYIQQQEEILGQLRGVAGGSLDVESQAAKVKANPETVALQKAALEKLYALTDPKVTAQERFLWEQLRGATEADQRSNWEAREQQMAQRGLRSGAMQIAGDMMQGQQLGQQRVLGELGIQGQAVGRSQQALGMYIDAQGRQRSQEFDEAFAAAAAGDQMAVSNAQRRLQGMGMSADQVNAMRAASFDEAYKRGIAADSASANNQATRLGGSTAAAQQTNAIRSANDAVGFFNTDQSNIMKRHQDTLAASEAQRITNLSQQQFGNTTTVNDVGYGRTTAGINAQAGALTTGQNANTALNDKTYQSGQDQFDRGQTMSNNDLSWALGGANVTGQNADRQLRADELAGANLIVGSKLNQQAIEQGYLPGSKRLT
jgi:hypothetical protein